VHALQLGVGDRVIDHDDGACLRPEGRDGIERGPVVDTVVDGVTTTLRLVPMRF
jgi:hypothetical protein